MQGLCCHNALSIFFTRQPCKYGMNAPRRAALLFGLNYEKCEQSARLTGCIRDVRDIAALLLETRRFQNDQIVRVTDDTAEGREALSLKGIKKALTVLARRSRSEKMDMVYVHFSGHGVQIPDASGDELDGMDECLVPEDYASGKLLSDDWLHAWLMTVHPGTRVVMVVDACHSGTALDLKAMEGRKVLYLSGCLDAQTSIEKTSSGVMTSRLISVLRSDMSLWFDAPRLHTALCAKLRAERFQQLPVLGTSHSLLADPVFMPSSI